LDLLCVALIAEGLPLGEVVREINRIRRDERRHSTGLPPGVGPYVLIGNPRARLAGFPMQKAYCEALTPSLPSASSYRLTVPASEADEGVLARCSLPGVRDLPYLTLHGAAGDLRCRGVAHVENDEAALYLWVRGAASHQVTIESAAYDSWQPARRSAAEVWGQLPFWTMFLDESRETLSRRGLPVDDLDQIIAQLPGWARFLSSAGLSLQLVPGELVSEDSKMAVCGSLWQQMRLWFQALLEALVHVRCAGAMHSYGTSPYYRLSDASGSSERCYCGEGTVTGQGFVAVDGRRMRVIYQCGTCGTIADEDGRRLLRVTRLAGRADRGGLLSCACDIGQTEDAYLHVHAILVLETWANGRELAGEPHEEILAPKTGTSFALYVEVPADLAPGVYPVSVLALVNGSLYLIRRMIQIA
jgi:hypothetical protein